jgi:hypothetical protein
MILPEKIKQKYLSILEDLIEKGEKVPIHTESTTRQNYFTGERRYECSENIDWPKFVE